ncbi:uncharacterized protein LOC108912699 [Anoplophora glabripennis]|uniref:uncharacterized protein LOC108912699 n=1 Tax=Anoplophora glabripennis TaxID=217634 RepID=UPI0008742616|nr:uncharacterized protein LOC108912699 [Anoplophora glabripennis]
MEEPSYYKYCLTPQCNNTTVTTPSKLFIRLPPDKKKRETWLKACKRDPTSVSSSSRVYICEDHFSLEEDMENFMKFKMVGGNIKMKRNVVPHIFDCQKDRERGLTHLDDPAAVKRVKRKIVEDDNESSFQDVPSTSRVLVIAEDIPRRKQEVPVKHNFGVMAKPSVRSKSIQCRISVGKSVALSPIKQES